MPMAVNSAPKF